MALPSEVSQYLKGLGQQKKDQPKKKGGLADFLPLAGAVAGSLIPGVGPILGPAIGAGLGTLGKQGIKQEGFNPGELAVETGLGALGGGVGSVAGKVLGGARGLLAGGKAAETGFVKAAGTGLRSKVINPQVPAGVFASGKEKAITQTAKGLKGITAGQKYANLEPEMNKLSSQVQNIIKSNELVYRRGDLTKEILSRAQRDYNFTPKELKTASELLQKHIGASKGTLSASRLHEANVRLNRVSSKAFGAEARGTTAAERSEVAKDVNRGIREILDTNYPDIKPFTQQMSDLIGSAPGLKDIRGKGLRLPVFGEIPGTSGPLQATQELGGRALEGLGSPLAGKIAGATAAQTGVRALAPSNETISVDLSQGLAPQAQASEGLSQYAQPQEDQDPLSRLADPEVQTQIYLADLANGGKNITELKTIFEGLAKPKVDANIQKQTLKLNDTEIIANQISQAFTELGGTGRIQGAGQLAGGLLGVNPKATAYESLRKASIGPLARAISGEVGVLTDKDIARAEGLLPRITDTPEEAELKLQNLYETISLKKQSVQSAPQSSGSLGDYAQPY